MKFEYKISLAYLLIGSIWIIFSDKILHYFIQDNILLTRIQTYKGWFYVLITALLLFSFLKRHLIKLRMMEKELARKNKDLSKSQLELEKHKDNLENLVKERTFALEDKTTELERYNQLFEGREFRIKELRDKIRILEEKLP